MQSELDHRFSALRNRRTASTYCHAAFGALTQNFALTQNLAQVFRLGSRLVFLSWPDVIQQKETDPVFKPGHGEIHGISYSTATPNDSTNCVPPCKYHYLLQPPITLSAVALRPSVMNRIQSGNWSRISWSEDNPRSATFPHSGHSNDTIGHHTGGRGRGTWRFAGQRMLFKNRFRSARIPF